jgi:hypothetical protein
MVQRVREPQMLVDLRRSAYSRFQILSGGITWHSGEIIQSRTNLCELPAFKCFRKSGFIGLTRLGKRRFIYYLRIAPDLNSS